MGIGTDSERVYFMEFRDGHAVLAAVPLGGGTIETIPTNLPVDRGVSIFDVSPDGKHLLAKVAGRVVRVAGSGQLWVVPLPGGGGRPLPGAAAEAAQWSPDGKRLAYFSGPDLYVARADGTQPELIASQPAGSTSIRWSPDGKRIRFSSGLPKQRSRFWEIPAEGGTPEQVFPDWDFQQDSGVWTGNGKYFLMYSSSDHRLWINREARLFRRGWSTPQQLTTGPLRFRSPRMIPGRNRVAAIGQLLRGKLLRWDAKAEQFVPHLGGISVDQLHYSADGSRVVYLDYPDGTLWIARQDGSERRKLAEGPMRISLPRISPDNSQVAFMGRMPGEPWKIYLVPASGGRPERLLPEGGAESDPNWSPGGDRLVYAPLPWEAAPGETGVRIVDMKTRSVEMLPDAEYYYSPRWSPDGRFIAALCQFNSNLALYDVEQQSWRTFKNFPVGFPAWSRDSRSIYLFHAYTKNRGIYRADVATGEIAKVASLIGIDVAGGRGRYGLSLDPHDAPVILSDESSHEIYALDLNLP